MSKASMDYGKANQAINDGHYGKFMNAINDIEDINEVDHNKNSLGHWIVAYKRIDWVDELTKKKFDWSVKNGQNMVKDKKINKASDTS
eukprot:gene10918-3623_t